MTKQERAIQWCEKIEDAKDLSLGEKEQIRNKTAKTLACLWFSFLVLVVLAVLIAPFLDIYIFTDNWLVDWMNAQFNNVYTRTQRRVAALWAVLPILPVFILLLIMSFLLRKRLLCYYAKRVR